MMNRRNLVGGLTAGVAMTGIRPAFGQSPAPADVDYIVIGMGSAGCVVANQLSRDRNTTVLALEAGGSDLVPVIQDPGDYLVAINSETYNWGYSTVAQAFGDDRRIGVPRGKVLGGCSSINLMIYIRGNRHDFDSWADRGNSGWSYEDVLPLFIAAEGNRDRTGPDIGNEGPLTVQDNPDIGNLGPAFVESAMAYGFDGPDWNFNGPVQDGGAGYYQYTVRDNERCSLAKAYLHPVMDRPNLTVQTGALVQRLQISNGRAEGAVYSVGGETREVRAGREVILCGGAFASPMILMRSGVGPADALRAVGIGVVLDHPGVGQNLQDHIFMPLCFNTVSEQEPYWGPGVLAGLFVKTRGQSSVEAPDLQYHFRQGFQSGPRRINEGFDFSPTLVRPGSRGEVRLASADPRAAPLINPNYLQTQSDMDTMLASIDLAHEIVAQPELSRITSGPSMESGLARSASRSEREAFVRAKMRSINHASCTCRMGTDGDAVVDPTLRVHGLDGLRVADASIMPDVITGNTNAACAMIGQKASDLILADAR